jgi:hypothetical protein
VGVQTWGWVRYVEPRSNLVCPFWTGTLFYLFEMILLDFWALHSLRICLVLRGSFFFFYFRCVGCGKMVFWADEGKAGLGVWWVCGSGVYDVLCLW